jgi:hypothetical protein
MTWTKGANFLFDTRRDPNVRFIITAGEWPSLHVHWVYGAPLDGDYRSSWNTIARDLERYLLSTFGEGPTPFSDEWCDAARAFVELRSNEVFSFKDELDLRVRALSEKLMDEIDSKIIGSILSPSADPDDRSMVATFNVTVQCPQPIESIVITCNIAATKEKLDGPDEP